MPLQPNLDILVNEIKKGNCAIFLGHGLLCDGEGNSMYSTICNQLAQDFKDYIHTYYPEESIFLLKDQRYRPDLNFEFEKCYKNLQPDMSLYKMLAEIPARLYITASPDTFLQQTFKGKATTSFFKDPKKQGTHDIASIQRPLIYSLFGSLEDNSSLALSHDDLFDFLKNTLGDKGLPEAIKTFFKEKAGGQAIFLGFTFKTWYVQLLLRLFYLTEPNYLVRTAYSGKKLEDDVTFANQHFRVDFIDTNIHGFITRLHQKCSDAGILRNLGDNNNGDNNDAQQILEEFNQRRIEELKEQLATNYDLRHEMEKQKILTVDPRELLKYTTEIKKIESIISALAEELYPLTVNKV